ncbi:PIN domain-containing protein [Pyrobaculum ferrireducens]|uniref:PIN domain-containing protein n=1 Tax=Pyrobaculum ferrireducens TaxID=1104324 RepID=UPI003083F366
MSRCKEQPCYVSELSLLEFAKVFLSKSLVHIEYHSVLKNYGNILEAPKEILNKLIRFLHEAGLSIEVVAVDKQVLDIVGGFLQRLKWEESVLRRKSFDLLLLAQSVARGVKIFTTDRDFINIRERALPPSGRDERRDRSSGLRYYEDDYIIYVGYS